MPSSVQNLLKNPLLVALDVDSDVEALDIADELKEVVGGFKVGPRLCLKYGAKLTRELALRAPLFMDQKHFDIPSTMESAVRTSFEGGASLVTIHGVCGREAMKRLAVVESELARIRPFQILCVSILTSWNQDSLPINYQEWPLSQHVKTVADEVRDCGLKGLVCSAHELELVQGQGMFVVVPGIRFDLGSQEDQKRTMSPSEALKKGASALVVGRPILSAKNRREAALKFNGN